ncbi:2-oxoglutarate and iron-dependent oxygenase domain-containing protein [Parvibaculum sp.]|uniref:isopenicillin N synthase family dioxygenase n=1 Tax=Parvibaculum sp. TaxID=2024848 RepID=UPI0032111B8A
MMETKMATGRAFDHIPLVDIAPLLGDDLEARKAVAREMEKAASEVGFLYVTGHGIAPELIENLQAKAAAFFALPEDVKRKYYIGNSRAHRGYVPMGEENFYSGDVPSVDKKEAFDLSIDLAENDPDHIKGYRLLGPNQWPSEVEGFKDDIYAYYEAATSLGHTLFRGFALALGLDENHFERYLTKPPSQLRLVHYPEAEGFDASAIGGSSSNFGISPHTDYECFTILHVTAPGLEVVNAEGKWIDAPPVPGAFVINIGDMLEAMTNGRFIATAHRVRRVAYERYSFPLFCSVDYDTVVEPLPQFVGVDAARTYPAYVAGDHLLAQTMRTFAYLRKLEKEGLIAIPESETTGETFFGRKERA